MQTSQENHLNEVRTHLRELTTRYQSDTEDAHKIHNNHIEETNK